MVCGFTAQLTAIPTGNSGHEVPSNGLFKLTAQSVTGQFFVVSSQ
ncbi:hypothetical protein SynMITS9220_01759 [Synechococcus sp. MIT S9220]|nr:hypothetical protein SynMITS9220_01759 [Synechococcus sp. MIT S9220]